MVEVVLKNGSKATLREWQKIYNLPIGSNQIGRHFTTTEPKIAENIKDYGKVVVNEVLIRLLDAFRERIGIPVILSAFNRSESKQEQLREQGYKAAKVSPHVACMAADIDTVNAIQTRNFAKQLVSTANTLGIKIRVGFEQYLSVGQTFVHVDVCPEYYAPGKPFHALPHPPQWEFITMW